jgi:hypothetical protein
MTIPEERLIESVIGSIERFRAALAAKPADPTRKAGAARLIRIAGIDHELRELRGRLEAARAAREAFPVYAGYRERAETSAALRLAHSAPGRHRAGRHRAGRDFRG